MTRVLSVASECVPLIKTGGLADVAGALPAALAPHGVGMRTLLPGYRGVMAAQGTAAPVVAELGDLFGGPARIRRAALGETALYLLDAPHLFDRDGGPYLGPDGKDWPDNPQRFAALGRAAAIIARDGIEGWRPQVLHLHDWQAGLAPVYLRQLGVRDVRTLLTIHNVAFQGLAPAHMLGALQLPAHLFTPQGFEYWGRISALKAGIVFADKVSTVSPTYAEELMTPEFGMGMEGVLADRGADFIGILNGIDLKTWTPPYSDTKGKARARAALRAEFGLPEAAGPLCVVISRLSEQKGLDLLIEALPALIENGGQLAVLGAGDPALEAALRAAAERNPTGVALRIGYDEALAHRMIEGGDAILVPSRFEPCGLTQMYGLRYGTLPVVSLTGGLADTVINASAAAMGAGVATGLQFHPVTAQALARTLERLVALYRQPELWQGMVANAMAQPVGWDASAKAYADLFNSMTTA
ncbi:glycogen synthase GlgA [Paracoccus sp. (in: a-proteobacteria)]|uniref:glycogen synthase GlgA n=1 Tax=Paracoccus sp. TaxID=267 RepID=UPI0035B4E4D6